MTHTCGEDGCSSVKVWKLLL